MPPRKPFLNVGNEHVCPVIALVKADGLLVEEKLDLEGGARVGY